MLWQMEMLCTLDLMCNKNLVGSSEVENKRFSERFSTTLEVTKIKKDKP